VSGEAGEAVAAGDVLAEVHARNEESALTAATAVQAAYALGSELPHDHGILLDIVS
jgi:thymidine phosphorylase